MKRRQFIVTVDIPHTVTVVEVHQFINQAVQFYGVSEGASQEPPPFYYEDWQKAVRVDYVPLTRKTQ